MKKSTPALVPFLFFVFVLFCGILIYAYIETKKANPQMIEVGQAVPPANPVYYLAPARKERKENRNELLGGLAAWRDIMPS